MLKKGDKGVFNKDVDGTSLGGKLYPKGTPVEVGVVEENRVQVFVDTGDKYKLHHISSLDDIDIQEVLCCV